MVQMVQQLKYGSHDYAFIHFATFYIIYVFIEYQQWQVYMVIDAALSMLSLHHKVQASLLTICAYINDYPLRGESYSLTVHMISVLKHLRFLSIYKTTTELHCQCL